MSNKKTRQEIFDEIDIAKNDMDNFYKKNFINYRGKTKNTNEYYTEIVAEWLLQDTENYLDKITKISRETSYKTLTHNGKIGNENTNRYEEVLAKKLFQLKKFKEIGEIIDYQMPLKNKKTDTAGKIDLLAYDKEKNILRILELKTFESMETMLRCVLKAYTYFKIVDTKKLLSDFGLPYDTEVRAAVLVFKNGFQHNEMKRYKTKSRRNSLKKLMEKLGIEEFYIRATYDNFTKNINKTVEN